MLLFLSDLPLNGSAMAAAGVDPAAVRVYHYTLIVRSIYDYYVPVLIVIGLLCNVVSIVVFSKSNFVGDGDVGGHGTSPSLQAPPSSSSSLFIDDSYDTYLSWRAVVDCVFLCCLFIVWLDAVNVRMYTTAGWCQVR